MDDESPGWDAITAALAAVYPGVTPVHVAPGLGVAFGSGVQGVSAYPATDHWHFVTYGLSELWAKQSDDPEQSELWLRVDDPSATLRGRRAPAGVAHQSARQARADGRSGSDYWIGHRLDLGGPIDGKASHLTGIAFVLDPQLGSITTPNGNVTFLQLVGVTRDELSEMRESTTAAVTLRFAVGNPLLISRCEPA